MVKIRLTRVGRKKAPYYRIVVVDSRRKRDGASIELLGRYQPLNKESAEQLTCNDERVLYWLHNGAQPTETVRALLRKAGVLRQFHEQKIANAKARKGQAATA